MQQMDPEDVKLKIKEWVAIQSGRGVESIGDEDSLLDGTLLDSFGQMTLSLLVEELLGRALRVEELAQIDSFRTVGAIARIYFSGAAKLSAGWGGR